MATPVIQLPRITPRKLRAIVGDPVKSAEAVNLVYVTDAQPGIARIKKGKGFLYRLHNKTITDKKELARIRSLVIPPAWQNVWICTSPNGHLQATGSDALNRKQYKYHSMWSAWRNQTKFFRLYEFGLALPAIRRQIERDLMLPGLPPEKVLALVLSLMQQTHIRIGSSSYEKLYGSFGLTTLKDKHAQFSGSKVNFKFKGKSGIEHTISIRSRRLSNLVKQCQDLPGKELFQYLDEENQVHSIDSGMVNNYIKTISKSDFTAKDFRTWAGSVQALLAFRELGFSDTVNETTRHVVEALDLVSQRLGNTRAVCRKYYVHPMVISLYESRGLEKYMPDLEKAGKEPDRSGLSAEEKVLMKILEREGIQKA